MTSKNKLKMSEDFFHYSGIEGPYKAKPKRWFLKSVLAFVLCCLAIYIVYEVFK